MGKTTILPVEEQIVSNKSGVEALQPIQSDPYANVGVSVQALTSPIKHGSEASITVKTNQRALCKIRVEYNKVASTDENLVDKNADEFGLVRWDWYVEDSVPIGKWPVEVTCYKNEKSGYVKGDLNVID